MAREDEDAEAPAPLKVAVDSEAISREIAAARALSVRARLGTQATTPKKQGDKP